MKRHIFLVAMLVVKKPVVVLKLNGKSIAQVIVDANSYMDGISKNPTRFPSPSPTLADITAAVVKLEASAKTAQSRSRSDVAIRNADLKALENLLKDLAHYVETICKLDINNAEAIAKQANMQLKTHTTPQKQDFVMTALTTTGEILMTAKSEKGRVTFNFELSTDPTNPALWKSVQNKSIAHAKVTGLTSGTRYYGRVFRTDKTGTYQVGQVLNVSAH
jgi:hypothetical protein